jgi:hypothetical protein
LVTTIPGDALLNMNGCIDDWTWCDVDWEGNRGWVYGNYLYYDYQSRRVPVIEYGAQHGIGIVAFSLGDYWGRYYPGRPWFGRRDYWMHRPPPPPHRPRGRSGRTRSRSGRIGRRRGLLWINRRRSKNAAQPHALIERARTRGMNDEMRRLRALR